MHHCWRGRAEPPARASVHLASLLLMVSSSAMCVWKRGSLWLLAFGLAPGAAAVARPAVVVFRLRMPVFLFLVLRTQASWYASSRFNALISFQCHAWGLTRYCRRPDVCHHVLHSHAGLQERTAWQCAQAACLRQVLCPPLRRTSHWTRRGGDSRVCFRAMPCFPPTISAPVSRGLLWLPAGAWRDGMRASGGLQRYRTMHMQAASCAVVYADAQQGQLGLALGAAALTACSPRKPHPCSINALEPGRAWSSSAMHPMCSHVACRAVSSCHDRPRNRPMPLRVPTSAWWRQRRRVGRCALARRRAFAVLL